jgi:hypothetical protein
MDDIPDHLKPIGQSLRELIGYSKSSDLSTNLSVKTDPITAVERAKLLAGCYRKSDAADPETYAGAVAAVLAEYPPDIVQRVTDPRSGLPSKLQWLPSVKEVRDACEELDNRRRYVETRAKQQAEQIAELKRLDAMRQTRPTLAEMKAKYGENWGISGEDKTQEVERDRRRSELQQRANQEIFARECEAAGLPPDSPVSPQLAALIKAGMA